MNNILATLYELFGYSRDFGKFLRGWQSDCADYGASQYPGMFVLLLVTVGIFYVFHYHVLNSTGFNKKSSCWVMGLLLALTNFAISFAWVSRLVGAGGYCEELKISETQDFILFSLASATYAFIIWAILTSSPIPRRFAGVNMNQTTLWKP